MIINEKTTLGELAEMFNTESSEIPLEDWGLISVTLRLITSQAADFYDRFADDSEDNVHWIGLLVAYQALTPSIGEQTAKDIIYHCAGLASKLLDVKGADQWSADVRSRLEQICEANEPSVNSEWLSRWRTQP
jgi:hypothetical protein